MSVDARINFGLSAIAVAPSPAGSGLALTLEAGGGAQFASICPFNATCWPPGVMPTRANAEIIRVESVSGDKLALVDRGQEGTGAQAIEPGWQFADMLTAKTIEDLKALVEAETARAEAAEASISSAMAAEVATERTRAETAEALLAPKASPALTGTPTAPTATALTDNTQLATTAYADGAVAVEKARAEAGEAAAVTAAEGVAEGVAKTTSEAEVKVERERAEAAELLKAPLASPGLTGIPTAPTPAAKTNTTQVATMAAVQAAKGEAETASDAAGTSAAGVKVERERAEAAEALKAPLASPVLTGTPKAPTAAAKTSTEQLATTAFTQTAKGEAETASDKAGAAATAQAAAEAASAQGFNPTAAKTGSYTASPGDYVPFDISGGSGALQLPTAPTDKTRVGAKIINVSGTPGSTTLTISRGGTDVFNKTGGSTSLSLSALFQGVVLQYKASTGIWYVQTTDTPLNEALGAALLGADGTVGGSSGSPLSSSIASSSVSRFNGQGYIWNGTEWKPEGIQTNRLKELGELSGNVTPNIAEGNAFTLVATGNTAVKPPINAINVREVVEIELIQNGAGGHTVTFSEMEPIGEAPIINTASNAVNLIQLVTRNRGSTWFVVGLQAGKEGAQGTTGATGATGPEGVSAIKTLTLAKQIETFIEPGASTKEKRNALTETYPRAGAPGFQMTSGVPYAAAMPVAANTTINGLAFLVVAEETETPTRTHLWVALLNEKGEVVKRGLDYTSKTNTPMPSTAVRGLRLESSYKSGSEPELLYAVVCIVMSAGKPFTLGHSEQGTPIELEPALAFKVESGLTTPASLKEKPTTTASIQRLWMAAI